MQTMNIADWIQVAVVVLAVVAIVAGQINRWAVANHHDRLAVLTSYCLNAAGRIQGVVRELPAGADKAAVKAALIAEAARLGMEEFDKTGPKVGATPQKLAGIIEGQLGALPTGVGLAGTDVLTASAMQAITQDATVALVTETKMLRQDVQQQTAVA